jgi:dipeptidyl aminopeptidase/acylaminoacyl peptidase
MHSKVLLGLALAVGAFGAHADPSAPLDLATAFGARESVDDLRLSPDGASVSFIGPQSGQGSALYTLSLTAGAPLKTALTSDGTPYRLQSCSWVSNERLVCSIYALVPDPQALVDLIAITRMVAVNADGSKLQLLTTRRTAYSRGYLTHGGEVIDWLPDEDGAVLMTRQYLADTDTSSRAGHSEKGLGVDRIDTLTLEVKRVITPRRDAVGYISDGRGTVRILAYSSLHDEENTGIVSYLYRARGSDTWRPLSEYNTLDRSGFRPLAVDPDLDVAYGFKKSDGRVALYSMSLGEKPHEELVFARPDVDIDGLVRIGRRRRVVGAHYTTEIGHSELFAPDVRQLTIALHKALPEERLLTVVDANVDESKLLIFASSDSDPGVYYIFDRRSHELHTFLVARKELEGLKLAHVKPISYPAADGVMIPGYLTLPPGADNARGLPAIVLPHGGPDSRDRWGFGWLSQYYAARGFAVLQPNFRGSTGYGDTWFLKNGFLSWDAAIGDVVAAGRWLVHEGIADPAKLAIVGWSYGGYAALQSGVVDPGLFKAIIAIAPVTDLAGLEETRARWTDAQLMRDRIGTGLHMHEGSPIEHVNSLKAPVMLFHGTADRNVPYEQSKSMAAALKSAGVRCEFVTYEDRDHGLIDSAVRADMLRKSDAFLRQALGM